MNPMCQQFVNNLSTICQQFVRTMNNFERIMQLNFFRDKLIDFLSQDTFFLYYQRNHVLFDLMKICNNVEKSMQKNMCRLVEFSLETINKTKINENYVQRMHVGEKVPLTIQ